MANHERALMEAPAASFPAEGSREPPPPLPARAVENKSLLLVDGVPDNALATKAGEKKLWRTLLATVKMPAIASCVVAGF